MEVWAVWAVWGGLTLGGVDWPDVTTLGFHIDAFKN